MLKKTFYIFLILTMCFALVSCGNKMNDLESNNSDESTNYEGLNDEYESNDIITEAQKETFDSNVSGIITLSLNKNGTIDIHCINPDSGTSYLVSSFNANNNNRFPGVSTLLFKATRREDFSSDFQKLAFDCLDKTSGHYYSYWVDSSGNIVNVYTQIFGVPGDFESKIVCHTYGFDKNNYYFYVKQNEEIKYYRVSSKNLSNASLEDLTDIMASSTTSINASTSDYDIYNFILFNKSDYLGFYNSFNNPYHIYNKFPPSHWKYEDARTEKLYFSVDDLHKMTSWGDNYHYYKNSCDSEGKQGIYYVSLNEIDKEHLTNSYEQILKVDGRTSIDAMASPDKSKIAFISWVNGESEANLFVAGSKGEKPQKINTDISFNIYYIRDEYYGEAFSHAERAFTIGGNGQDNTYLLAWV